MSAHENEHHRHTVLIVEDDPHVLNALRDILERDGYEVLTATNGEEALVVTSVTLPCIVLTDIQMPKMDGLVLCRRLKQDPQTSHIPVVLVTIRVSSSDVDKGIEAGAVDYIKKPFDRAEVRMRVRTQIRLHEALFQKDSAEKQLRLISSSANDAIIMIDSEGCVSHWNESAESMFGYSRHEALGQDLHNAIVPKRFHEQHHSAFSHYQETGQGNAINQTLEIAALRKNGEEFPVELSLSAALVDNKWHSVGIIRDITERKNLQGQLLHAQKLEAVGQLASGLAHEINTPTQFVQDSVTFLSDAIRDQHELIGTYRKVVGAIGSETAHESLLKQIEQAEQQADIAYLEEQVPDALKACSEGLSRISNIVTAMIEFAHPDQEKKDLADINHALQTTLTIAKNEYRSVADVETELGDLPLVMCHLGDLNQVFLNLIVNAAHAIEDAVEGRNTRGTIRVRTSSDGDTAQIEIEDTGNGIPEADQSRIFDPFFTTKEVGKGSGQGLSIAHTIVTKKHKGTLTVRTVKDKGTILVVKLPVGQDKKNGAGAS